MWSVPCVEAHPIMRSLRSKGVEPLLVLCDLCGSLLELVTAARRRVKSDTCENNEKSDDKCLHDSLRLKIPSQSRKRFAICEEFSLIGPSVKSVNIIRRLARIPEDGSLAILSAVMFDAQYWALIENNSGRNVPEKVSLRLFLMVGWHDGTYLNLFSKVRNGFILHLCSAIIRATEKTHSDKCPIQQF